MRAAARVVDLVQGYGRHTVLDGFNLAVRPGVLGVLGPTGAGKSTLLKTLATVLPPFAGRVEVLGREVLSERGARWTRREVGYLAQDFGFQPSFSVREYVAYSAWLRECTPDRDQVERALEAVELTPYARTRMRKLDAGQLRRAGLAGAVVGGPRLVLLDEPTRGSEAGERVQLLRLIGELASRWRATVVLATRLAQDVAYVCDEVAVLHRGRLLFADSPAALARVATRTAQVEGWADAAADGRARPAADGAALERGYLSVLHGPGDWGVRGVPA